MSNGPNKIITLQELINAQVDAYKLEQIMNEAPWVEITTRLGRKCYSIATINAIIEQFQLDTQSALSDLQDAIAQIVEGGVPDLAVSTFSGRTQEQENKDFVTSVYDYTELSALHAGDGRSIFVKKEGVSGGFVYLPNSTKTPDGGTVVLDSQGRKWERSDLSNPKLSWWEAVGDNVADDTVALRAANTFFRTHKIYVDGDGKTYKSTTRGTWLRYLKNATVRVDVDSLSVVYNADGDYAQLTDGIPRGFGRGEFYSAKLGMCMRLDEGYSSGVYIGGFETLKNVTSMTSNIVIGDGIMSVCDTATAPRFNIAIGDSAMTYAVNTGGGTNGTRNIAIGTLALHFMTNGACNVALGRNAAHNITSGRYNTAIGYSAGMQGTSPIGWTGKIEMQLGNGEGIGNTSVGSSAGQYGNGSFNTIIGRDAAPKISTANSNVIVGHGVGFNLDTNISYLGTTVSYANTPGTYTISGSTVTVVLASEPSIGLTVGGVIGLACSTGDLTVESGKLTVTQVVNATTFRFALPTEKASATIGGNCSLFYHIKATIPANSPSGANVLMGRNAVYNKLTCQESVVLGGDAVGTGVGGILSTVAIGTRALQYAVTCANNTAVGHESLRLTIAGNVASTMTNCGGFGYQARISGDNQIQLGNSANTVYAYGAIQDRSDIRDKADIEAMPDLMTQFILELNPVQGRWDMRDDYVDDLPEDWTDEQKKEWWSNPIKDGSKKRSRKHNWFIAQEVKALSERLGIDFAGVQDHSVNGGTDTLSIGYEEFIPPIVATIQKLSKRMGDIESRLDKLEK